MEDVQIRTEQIALGQLLKLAGVADTGGAAKELLAQGAVQVNGRTEVRRGSSPLVGGATGTRQPGVDGVPELRD